MKLLWSKEKHPYTKHSAPITKGILRNGKGTSANILPKNHGLHITFSNRIACSQIPVNAIHNVMDSVVHDAIERRPGDAADRGRQRLSTTDEQHNHRRQPNNEFEAMRTLMMTGERRVDRQRGREDFLSTRDEGERSTSASHTHKSGHASDRTRHDSMESLVHGVMERVKLDGGAGDTAARRRQRLSITDERHRPRVSSSEDLASLERLSQRQSTTDEYKKPSSITSKSRAISSDDLASLGRPIHKQSIIDEHRTSTKSRAKPRQPRPKRESTLTERNRLRNSIASKTSVDSSDDEAATPDKPKRRQDRSKLSSSTSITSKSRESSSDKPKRSHSSKDSRKRSVSVTSRSSVGSVTSRSSVGSVASESSAGSSDTKRSSDTPKRGGSIKHERKSLSMSTSSEGSSDTLASLMQPTQRLCDMTTNKMASCYGKWESNGTLDTAETSDVSEEQPQRPRFERSNLSLLLDEKIEAKMRRKMKK